MRHAAQVGAALVASLVAALVVLVTVSVDAHRGITLAQAVIIDGPALFLQGAILADVHPRRADDGREFGGQGADAFTPMGAAVPGSPHEAAALRAGLATSEVFPLTLFAVVGMMLFPAAGDLLTMFVALEVLSLPLYLLCGLARRRRLLSQEASLKYFLLGAFSSAFFLFGAALLYGYAARSTSPTSPRRSRLPLVTSTACSCPAWCSCSSACCSRSARCPSTRGPRTSTRAPPPR